MKQPSDSAAQFCSTDFDLTVDCLPGTYSDSNPKKYEPITVSTHASTTSLPRLSVTRGHRQESTSSSDLPPYTQSRPPGTVDHDSRHVWHVGQDSHELKCLNLNPTDKLRTAIEYTSTDVDRYNPRNNPKGTQLGPPATGLFYAWVGVTSTRNMIHNKSAQLALRGGVGSYASQAAKKRPLLRCAWRGIDNRRRAGYRGCEDERKREWRATGIRIAVGFVNLTARRRGGIMRGDMV